MESKLNKTNTMQKKKQVLKSFPLDAEAEQALKILTDKGFNVSRLLRELLKEEAKKHMVKTPEPQTIHHTPVLLSAPVAPRLSAKGIDYEAIHGMDYDTLAMYLQDYRVNSDETFTYWQAVIGERPSRERRMRIFEGQYPDVSEVSDKELDEDYDDLLGAISKYAKNY